MEENPHVEPENFHEWIKKESHDDPFLEELLKEREWLFEAANPAKGHDKAEIQEEMRTINDRILKRKQELGIDPFQEP
jgi:hypothetical protein